MSRSDRRLWKSAVTLADLGERMARWLEGTIASRPGYAARYGPDEETVHLVPTLAAACRAGYITTVSQPGLAETSAGGMRWEQRAAVTGLVTDPGLQDRLITAALEAGLVVLVDDYDTETYADPYIVTTVDGEPFTAFGGQVSHEDMAAEWHGLHPALASQTAGGTYVTLAAPEYGTAGERLWTLLDRLTGHCRQGAVPWAAAS
ncbi:DUF6919 domain-containing protein [Streptomyces sp. NPDC001930]|uniref:DUF6919 domain-containing protein n=1 Tax=Streptomyces sp. NPDC001930 TaxID=3364625 RepID=UPI0036B7CAD8